VSARTRRFWLTYQYALTATLRRSTDISLTVSHRGRRISEDLLPSWIHLFHNLKQRTQTFGMCGSPIELDAETLGDGVFRIEPSLQSGSDQPPSLSTSIGVLRLGPSRRSVTRHSSTGHSFTRHFVHNFGEGVHTLCQFKTSPGYRPCRLHKVLNV
jgi:hypothetical protein